MTRNKLVGVMFDGETLKRLDWERYKESQQRGKKVHRSTLCYEVVKRYLKGDSDKEGAR